MKRYWEKIRKRKWRLQKTSLFEQLKAGRGMRQRKWERGKASVCVLFFSHRHKLEFWKHLALAFALKPRGGTAVLRF
jgi:hypothetical protein